MTGKPPSLHEHHDELAELADIAEMYEMVEGILKHLPSKFRQDTESLLIKIENYASTDILQHLHLYDKYDLLGLYRGIPIPLKYQSSPYQLPDTVFLFRGPLIKYASDNHQSLKEVIYHVLIHEVGHHFGFSDEDMKEIEGQPDSET